MVTLTLKPRNETADGIPTWHDSFRLQAALDQIGRGKPVSQLGIWFSIAKKVQVAQEESGMQTQIGAEVVVELEEGEAKALWREVEKLPPEAFRKNPLTGQADVPDLGTLGEMLEEWRGVLESPSTLD